MGSVHPLKIRTTIYEYERCSGCREEINDDSDYMVIVLPYEDYDKHILLCDSCYKEFVAAGVNGEG